MLHQETQATILLRSAPLEEQRHFGKLEREEEGKQEEGARGGTWNGRESWNGIQTIQGR